MPWLRSSASKVQTNVFCCCLIVNYGVALHRTCYTIVCIFGPGIFWGFAGSPRDFFGSWLLAPFDHPRHLKSRVPPLGYKEAMYIYLYWQSHGPLIPIKIIVQFFECRIPERVLQQYQYVEGFQRFHTGLRLRCAACLSLQFLLFEYIHYDIQYSFCIPNERVV